MQTFNFFANQFVEVADMLAIQSVPQSAIKDILVSLINKGVISGVSVTPTTPTPSLGVVVTTGKVVLENGTTVTTAAATSIDLSAKVAALLTGQSAWATLYAVPTQVSDTPVVTPAGTTIQYRTYDAISFMVVMGTATTGTPVKSTTAPVGFTGVLIGDVLLTHGQTQIVSGNISTSRLQTFVNIPYLLNLINTIAASVSVPPWPESNITGLVSDLAAINSAIATVQGHQTTDEGNITTLLSEMTTANNNITTIQGQIGTLNGAISTINGEITTIQGTQATDHANISTLITEMSAVQTNQTADETDIIALQAFKNGFTSGTASSGYWRKEPDGYIKQWGRLATDINGGTVFIAFPHAFTNVASISVVVTTLSGTDRITFVVEGSIGTNGFTVGNNGSDGFATWHAEGY